MLLSLSWHISVSGITNEEITFGAPQYENEYTYNGESYNPNIESQYLRARYYYVVTATFLTEDSYLGNIGEPLTLNRYLYGVASPLNYRDPSGHDVINDIMINVTSDSSISDSNKGATINRRVQFYLVLKEMQNQNDITSDYINNYDYTKNESYINGMIGTAENLEQNGNLRRT